MLEEEIETGAEAQYLPSVQCLYHVGIIKSLLGIILWWFTWTTLSLEQITQSTILGHMWLQPSCSSYHFSCSFVAFGVAWIAEVFVVYCVLLKSVEQSFLVHGLSYIRKRLTRRFPHTLQLLLMIFIAVPVGVACSKERGGGGEVAWGGVAGLDWWRTAGACRFLRRMVGFL